VSSDGRGAQIGCMAAGDLLVGDLRDGANASRATSRLLRRSFSVDFAAGSIAAGAGGARVISVLPPDARVQSGPFALQLPEAPHQQMILIYIGFAGRPRSLPAVPVRTCLGAPHRAQMGWR
jgi:hypothetical protein